MRTLLLLLLALPFFSAAQVNRSAREFAGEQIRDYIVTKLFKNLSYKPISLGQLKARKEDNDPEFAWALEHEFDITETRKPADQKTAVPKRYKFIFFLDSKMKILRAETFSSQG